MQWKTDAVNDTFVLTLRGEKRKAVPFHLVLTGVFVCGVHFLVFQSSARLYGEIGGILWAILIAIRQQFGVSVLTISPDTVSLNRHTFGLGRARHFARSDTERLGYEPEAGQDDAALAIMIRTVMMPIRFAHGITPGEAQEVFAAIKTKNCWIGSMIRPVGTAMF